MTNLDNGNLDARLRELAEGTAVPDAGVMEQRLLKAFAPTGVEAPVPSGVQDRRAWRPLAAAAMLALTVGATWYGLSPRVPDAAPPVRGTAAQPPASPAAAVAPAPAPAPTAPPAAKPRPRARRQPAVDDLAHTIDFVVLPEAAELPAFESGRIVRIEVPLAMLPAYGLDLVPDAAPTRVEADLLVGQDGLPRAIRLASTTSPYRSR